MPLAGGARRRNISMSGDQVVTSHKKGSRVHHRPPLSLRVLGEREIGSLIASRLADLAIVRARAGGLRCAAPIVQLPLQEALIRDSESAFGFEVTRTQALLRAGSLAAAHRTTAGHRDRIADRRGSREGGGGGTLVLVRYIATSKSKVVLPTVKLGPPASSKLDGRRSPVALALSRTPVPVRSQRVSIRRSPASTAVTRAVWSRTRPEAVVTGTSSLLVCRG